MIDVISQLPKSLPEYQQSVVEDNLRDRSFVSKCARESVGANDIGRLLPCQWLNDEIINFWGALLMDRAERWKKGKGKAGDDDKNDLPRFGVSEPLANIHYFNTFFYAKLVDLGYEKARLAKWTKMVGRPEPDTKRETNNGPKGGYLHKRCHPHPDQYRERALDHGRDQHQEEADRVLR
jgi:hypothetical protein